MKSMQSVKILVRVRCKDVNGETITKCLNFSNIRPTATDAQIAAFGEAVEHLQSLPVRGLEYIHRFAEVMNE